MDWKKGMTGSLILTVLLLLLGIGSMASAAPGKITPSLNARLQADAGKSFIPVIVKTTAGMNEGHEDLVAKNSGRIKHDLPIIKAFAAELPPSAIDELSRRDDVEYITSDDRVEALLDVATGTIGAPTVWANGYTGKNITVAVIDTGIYPHQDLTAPDNRIVAFKDVVNNYSLPYDDNGHGTMVAGMIAGNGMVSKGQYKGVAPQAKLVGVKALDSSGRGSASDVIAGIQWVVQTREQYGTKVLSLSLGSQAIQSYATDPLCQAVEAAWKVGIVVVAAAGNNGPGDGTITSPGIDPFIITVGASDDRGTVTITDDGVASFSSRGPTVDGLSKPDLVAPGVIITSIKADTTYRPKKNSGSGGPGGKSFTGTAQGKPSQTTTEYSTMSGTSAATPIVSGAIALLLEQNPALTPDKAKTVLEQKVVNLGEEQNVQGAGLLQCN